MVFAFIFATAMCQLALAEKKSPKGQTEWAFTDIGGQAQVPFSEESVQFSVVVFVSTDCPIANFYQSTIKRLAKRYQGKGVRFLLFHTDLFVSSEKRKEQAKEYQISSPVFSQLLFGEAIESNPCVCVASKKTI